MTSNVADAYKELTGHRWYPYRGCAPDTDNPRQAAGNPALSVDAWAAPDVDGGEDQKTRRAREDAAIDVCMGCPVMVQCDTYASSLTPDGRLAEPDGVWGGRRALERHRDLIRTRHQITAAAPDARFRTAQKQAVLRALAARTDPFEVAQAAGLDLRTANWQRSQLVTLLNLNKATATRRELLAEAARRGLLDGVMVVDDDGAVPAVPPPAPARPRAQTPPAAPTPPSVRPDRTPTRTRTRARPRMPHPPAFPPRAEDASPHSPANSPSTCRWSKTAPCSPSSPPPPEPRRWRPQRDHSRHHPASRHRRRHGRRRHPARRTLCQ